MDCAYGRHAPPYRYPPSSAGTPAAIFIVGVNGAGKTTTVGKLAYNYGKEGTKVRQGGDLGATSREAGGKLFRGGAAGTGRTQH